MYSHHCISLTLLSAVFKREYRGVHSSQKVQFDSTCRGVPTDRMVALSSPVQRGLIIIMLAVVSRVVVPSFPAAVVSHANIPACMSPRLAFCDGAVDGSQDGAAHGLGASCAGVVDLEAGDHVVGELGLAEDGDTVVRCFADAVKTRQFVFS